jgi:hypothetical protein
MDTPSDVQANNPLALPAARTYTININPYNPVGLDRTDSSLMRLAELHERTHISADQAYSTNQNQSRLALQHGDVNAANFFPTVMNPHNNAVAARLIRLEGIVQSDKALTQQQREEIMTRVQYAGNYIEYDPVINELLAYTREYGIAANSATVKALVVLVRENLVRRQPGGQNLHGTWPT